MVDKNIALYGQMANSWSPIYGIPTEILISIFDFAIAPRRGQLRDSWERSMTDYRILYTIAATSQSWRTIVFSSCSLWSYIAFGDPFWRRALENSGSSPIDLVSPASDEFHQITSAEAHRCRTLTLLIRDRQAHSSASSMLCQEVPLLHSLCIRQYFAGPWPEFSWPNAPRLRNLELHQAMVSPPLPSDIKLRALKLEYIGTTHWFSAFKLIQLNPGLEELVIEGIANIDPSQRGSALPREAISFPNLQQMKLVGSFGAMMYLLSWMRADALESFEMEHSWTGATDPQFELEDLPSWSVLPATMRRVSLQSSGLTEMQVFERNSVGYVSTSYHNESRVAQSVSKFMVIVHCPLEMLWPLFSAWPFYPDSAEVQIVDMDLPFPNDVKASLSRIPNLTRIDTPMGLPNVDFWRWLSQPQVEDGEWPLPNLKLVKGGELEFIFPDLRAAMNHAVKARGEASSLNPDAVQPLKVETKPVPKRSHSWEW